MRAPETARFLRRAAPAFFRELSKEYAELTPVAETVTELTRAQQEMAEAEHLLTDPEMKAEAQHEIAERLIRLGEAEDASSERIWACISS